MWKHNIGVPCLCRNASYISFRKWNISCPYGIHSSISSSNTCRACNCAQPHVTGHVWHVTRAIHYNKELHCDQSASPIAATSPRYRDQPKEMWSQTSWLASSNLQVIYSHPWICHHKHKSKIHSWGRKNSLFWSQRGHVNFYLLIFQSPCWDLQHSCTNSDL